MTDKDDDGDYNNTNKDNDDKADNDDNCSDDGENKDNKGDRNYGDNNSNNAYKYTEQYRPSISARGILTLNYAVKYSLQQFCYPPSTLLK